METKQNNNFQEKFEKGQFVVINNNDICRFGEVRNGNCGLRIILTSNTGISTAHHLTQLVSCHLMQRCTVKLLTSVQQLKLK
jgi:hypothetical protein